MRTGSVQPRDAHAAGLLHDARRSRSASRNGPALPSMIGGSGPSSAIIEIVDPERRHRGEHVLHRVHRVRLLAELGAPLGEHGLIGERGDRRQHRAGRCARTAIPAPLGAGGTSSVHGDAEVQPDPRRRDVARAIVRRISARPPRRAPSRRSSARISDGSLNIAACARSASRCGRAGYPDQVSPAGTSPNTPACAPMRAPLPDRRRARRCPPGRRGCTPSSMRAEPGDADLRHEQAEPADPHVVRDVHEVVDLRPRADHRVVDAAAIDRRVRADLDVVLDDAPADVRDLRVRAVAEHVAEAVGPEPRAGVHAHALAELACPRRASRREDAGSPRRSRRRRRRRRARR